MRNIFKVISVFSLLVVPVTCFAEEKLNDHLTQTLMHKSGLKKQIDQIPALLQYELNQQQQKHKNLTDEDFNRISKLARQAFDAKSIYDDVQVYIESNLSAYDIKTVLEWLESPLGKKITKLEEYSSTIEAQGEMELIAPKLLEENKNSARIVKIKELDNLTGATEASVSTVLNIQLAMMTSMSAATNADNQPSFEEIQDLVGRNKLKIQAAMETMGQIQFLYTYRTLTDEEIDMYIKFAGSESGKKYHSITSKGINYAFVLAARGFGARIGMKMNRI
ncbi:MAG TPA: hypothetical protein VN368_02430 [Candidatus Methylomirabilis sp.]|nr:hypothetical protein [Candidatus Methylomirabilis sp.]